jgi:hypothetical protein
MTIFTKVSDKKMENLMVRENYVFYYQITIKLYLANGFKKVCGLMVIFIKGLMI